MNALLREHGSRLEEDSLRTFLCEAEYTINNRPLTEKTISDPHSATPSSPSMLLTGKTRLVLSPPGEFKREHSIWLKNSGQDGAKNIRSSCKQETSGFGQEEIFRSEMCC